MNFSMEEKNHILCFFSAQKYDFGNKKNIFCDLNEWMVYELIPENKKIWYLWPDNVLFIHVENIYNKPESKIRKIRDSGRISNPNLMSENL